MKFSPISFDDLRRIRDEQSLPVVLTGEEHGSRSLWVLLLNLFLETIPANKKPTEWFGLQITIQEVDIVQSVVFFGNSHNKKFGKLTDVTITRYDNETIQIFKYPTALNGAIIFECRASSEEFASIVRLLAKSCIS